MIRKDYLPMDPLGSIRAITVGTAGGGVSLGDLANPINYRPYGEVSHDEKEDGVLGLPDEDRGFIGERFDDEAGLQYLNARYYDPKLGLFTSPDWYEVALPGLGANRYAYARNDPFNLMDPGENMFTYGGLVTNPTFDPSTAIFGTSGTQIANAFNDISRTNNSLVITSLTVFSGDQVVNLSKGTPSGIAESFGLSEEGAGDNQSSQLVFNLNCAGTCLGRWLRPEDVMPPAEFAVLRA
ncbi:MAG: RHS repeat-associated core domain-containing protein [Pseudomonadota bacterium]